MNYSYKGVVPFSVILFLLRILRKIKIYFIGSKAKMLTHSSNEQLIKSLGGLKSVNETLEDLHSLKRPLFFINPEHKQEIVDILQTNFPADSESSADINQICDHTFDLLGSGKKCLNKLGKSDDSTSYKDIDWHKDFKSGVVWDPHIFYTDIRIIKNAKGSDIKVPWELSRFQHLPTLGKAYWLSGDEKYAREFINEINDWIQSNPPFHGVNWACTMDVAIRVVNWIWGYYFFKDSPETNDEFLLKFLRSFYAHEVYIKANLERSLKGINSNHYLSDIAGLVFMGVVFPEFNEIKKCGEFGIKELINEMKKQVYPDGVDYEGSISYHRLVTEIFLSSTLLCLKNGVSFPNWYMERLEKMIEFVMYYIKPDGTAPQIGDNDDGRLHVLSKYGNWSRLDHKYLLSVGAVLFNRHDFKKMASEFQEEALWLLGKEGLMKFDDIKDKKVLLSSKSFQNCGYYILRDNYLYMIIDCIPAHHRLPSGHMHNSRLSFELFAQDKSFIVDPGAYIYTADKKMRNLFRSTRYHNTVVVDKDEQNKFDDNYLFAMELDAMVHINRWEVESTYDFLDAEHSGYARLKDPIIHRRQIYFNKLGGYWVIKDILRGKKRHEFDLYFHFAPMNIKFDSKSSHIIKSNAGCGWDIAIIPMDTDGLSCEIQDGLISYSYGTKIQAPIVKYSKTALAPTEFLNIIYPFKKYLQIEKVLNNVKHDINSSVVFK